MQISFLIVTKNRPEDLAFTLHKLKAMIDLSAHEVLVFIDGCTKTEALVDAFDWVKWTVSKHSISASPARHTLYKKAQGTLLIGLDDDAHPIGVKFITQVEYEFNKNKKLGILAFQEVRGLFQSDEIAIKKAIERESYLTNDFVGCGFAIKRDVYCTINGFPLWMDIYGEETAVAIEVLDMDYEILYQPSILVNHRVDVEKRKVQGRNYFRFEKQLQNAIRFYVVYYKNPIQRIVKLLLHNLKTYALKDHKYFLAFVKVCFKLVFKLPFLFKFRSPVSQSTISKRLTLKGMQY